MVDLTLKTARGISYSQLYDGETPNLTLLINNIPSRSAIAWLAYIIFRMDFRYIDEYGNEESELQIFIPIMMQTNEDMKRRISNFMGDYYNGLDQYINRYSLLQLIDFVLSHHNDDNRILKKDDYTNLLKAYFVICDKYLEYTSKAYNSIDISKLFNLYLPVQPLTNDIEYPRDISLELVKSKKFLIDFPKLDSTFARYINIFLRNRKIESASAYMSCVFEQVVTMVTSEKKTNLIEYSNDSPIQIHFMDNLCIDCGNYRQDESLNSIREFPIYKLSRNRYAILSMRFFINKLFSGILFDMADALVHEGEFENRIKAYITLKQRIGESFSEHYLLYSVLNSILSYRFPIRLEGQMMHEILASGEPDYYARRNSRIFLFEFKDIQMNQATKSSLNYEDIKTYLYENFVCSKSGRPKGIGQLVKVISLKLCDIFNKIDAFPSHECLKIYPILIYSDNSFDIEGVNYYLNNEFKKIKPVLENQDVKDVIMINIDILMSFEDYFLNGKLKFDVIVNEYLSYKESSSKHMTVPFNKFLFQYARKKNIKYNLSKTFRQTFDELLNTEKSNTVI